MARTATLRASDADRERIVERLRHAAGEGRLAAHELEQRVGSALVARTYGELEATVADLPRERAGRRPALATLRAHPALLVALIPLVLVAVVIVAAITVASLAIGAALLLLGRRRAFCLGPAPFVMRRLAPPRSADRLRPGQWSHWA